MNDWWWRFRTRLMCMLFHRKHVEGREWELVQMPIRGLKYQPAVWRVWRYCSVCSRGRASLFRQKEEGCGFEGSHKARLPEIQSVVFVAPDGCNPREK